MGRINDGLRFIQGFKAIFDCAVEALTLKNVGEGVIKYQELCDVTYSMTEKP